MLTFSNRWRAVYCLALVLDILLLGGCRSNEPPPSSPPNILLILTDDLGNNDIPSWGDGLAPTPTIDQLSQQSVRFRNHYTDSTCSPSRASLLTGKRAIEVGFQPNGLGLSSDLPTLPKSLKALGYHTIHLGKWHVGEALEYPEIQPGNQGFDYWWGALNHFVLRGPGPNGEIVQGPSTHIDPWLQENGNPPRQYKGYLDDLLVDKAISLIRKSDNQPWFINLWLHSPHVPWQPSPAFKAQFPDTPEGNYLAVLKQLDHNVARLLTALNDKELAANTIVVFASDNGSPLPGRNFPLLGVKSTYLQGGVRSPLLLRWPGHFAAGDIRDVSDITDLYPTLLALAGGQIPSGLSGRDLSPALRGEPLQARHALYWASDVGPLGMSFGGALLDEGRGYYRELSGKVSTYAIAPPIGVLRPELTPEPLQPQQVNIDIAAWEREARHIPVTWTASATGGSGQMTGRDFQRAPVFGGYSLGLGLSKPTTGNEEQTLVYQEGIWSLGLDTSQRLRLRFGDVEILSNPVTLQSECNTLVASFDVQQAYSHPFKSEARSRVLLYLNGQTVLDSTKLLLRPTSAVSLPNPTYIGVKPDGSTAYHGRIAPPLLINKMLLPEQDGYRLKDMSNELCGKQLP